MPQSNPSILRCLLCRGDNLYRDKESGECRICPKVGERIAVMAAVAVPCSVLLIGSLVLLLHPIGGRFPAMLRPRRFLAWLAVNAKYIGIMVSVSSQKMYCHLCFSPTYTSSLLLPNLVFLCPAQPKFKIVFSFYGIAASLDSTYDARMPPAYTDWVRDAFSWARVDWPSIMFPPECTPFATNGSSFRAWLLIKGLAPLVAIVVPLVGATVIKCFRLGGTLKNVCSGMLQAVPHALFISFCLVPSVSATIFESWLCVEYQDDGSALYREDGSHLSSISMRFFLSSDLRLQCPEHGFSNAEHVTIKAIASIFVAIWPVGFVAMYTLALLPCRSSLRGHVQTPLVRATRFLHSE